MSGFEQAAAFCQCLGVRFDFLPSRTDFRFRTGAELNLGNLTLRIPLPNGATLLLCAHMGEGDITVWIGLRVMRRRGLVLDVDQDVVRPVRPDWKMRIVDQFGHASTATLGTAWLGQ